MVSLNRVFPTQNGVGLGTDRAGKCTDEQKDYTKGPLLVVLAVGKGITRLSAMEAQRQHPCHLQGEARLREEKGRSGHTEIVGPTILVTRASCSLSLLCPVEFLPYQPLLGRHTGNCSGPLVVKGTRNSFKKQTEPRLCG